MNWIELFKIIVIVVLALDTVAYLKEKIVKHKKMKTESSHVIGLILGIVVRLSGLYFIWN